MHVKILCSKSHEHFQLLNTPAGLTVVALLRPDLFRLLIDVQSMTSLEMQEDPHFNPTDPEPTHRLQQCNATLASRSNATMIYEFWQTATKKGDLNQNVHQRYVCSTTCPGKIECLSKHSQTAQNA